MPTQETIADLKLLGLPSHASMPQVQHRYQQLGAVFACNTNSSPKLVELCSTTREKLHAAYSRLLQAQPQQPITPPPATASKVKILNFIWPPVVLIIIIAVFSHHPSPEPNDSTSTGSETPSQIGTDTGTTTSTTGSTTDTTPPVEPPKPNPADDLLRQRELLIAQRQKYWDANRDTQSKIIALDNKVNDLNYQIVHLQQISNLDFGRNWDYANQVNPQACQQYLDYKQQVKDAEQERQSLYPIDNQNSKNYVDTNELLTRLDDKLRAMGVTPPS
jgi:hypothetical protein